ncbi:MAG: hypothetical protein AB4368_24990 [Xenococcaceae cyanobacterium]
MANQNPETKHLMPFAFKPKGEETLSVQMNVRISPSLNAELKKKKNWQEFVRQAIAKALDEENNLKSA